MIKFMEEVKTLGYTDKPDYAKLRHILQQGLKSIGAADDDKLNFAVSGPGAGPSSVKVRPLHYYWFVTYLIKLIKEFLSCQSHKNLTIVS